jgi:hypothetical protein
MGQTCSTIVKSDPTYFVFEGYTRLNSRPSVASILARGVAEVQGSLRMASTPAVMSGGRGLTRRACRSGSGSRHRGYTVRRRPK